MKYPVEQSSFFGFGKKKWNDEFISFPFFESFYNKF